MTVPATYANMGVLQTNFYTTVFDETGRPVSRASFCGYIYTGCFFWYKIRLVLLLSTESTSEVSVGVSE